MFEKIKEFFQSKTVKIVEAVVIALGSAGLILGGIGADEIGKIPTIVAGIVLAVEALITFIQGFTTKK